MANVAVSVAQSLAQHAFRLLGIADLNALLVFEDSNGNRLWTANGKLRNEFTKQGRIDHREWGMMEIRIENGTCLKNDDIIRDNRSHSHPDSKTDTTSTVSEDLECCNNYYSSESGLIDPLSKNTASFRHLGEGYPHLVTDGNNGFYDDGNWPTEEPQVGYATVSANNSVSVKLVTDNTAVHQNVETSAIGTLNEPLPMSDLLANLSCSKCGKTGHIASLCYANCLLCGASDHLGADCRLFADEGLAGAGLGYETDSGYDPECGQNYNGRQNPQPNLVTPPQWASETLTCTKCGGAGHESLRCPVKPMCSKCFQFGHRILDCPFANSGRVKPSDICFQCGETGHRKATCPKTICHKCGDLGHIGVDCKILPQRDPLFRVILMQFEVSDCFLHILCDIAELASFSVMAAAPKGRCPVRHWDEFPYNHLLVYTFHEASQFSDSH